MRNLALMCVLAALFILNVGSCNSKSANGLADSGSAAIKPKAAVTDSVLWFKNTSSIELRFEIDGLGIYISGAADGAIAKYSNMNRINGGWDDPGSSYAIYADDKDETKEEDFLEVRLDTEMWQNILKRLFGTGIREWGKYDVSVCPCYIYILDHVSSYKLKIFNRDSGDILVGSCGCYYEIPKHQPANWPVFYDEMSSIIREIIKIPLDTEHKKRFGTPASDFEQSFLILRFEETIVLKRMNGAIMAMNTLILDPDFDWDKWLALDVSDWFDIIHALGNGACESDTTAVTEKPVVGKVFINLSTKHFGAKKAYVTPTDEFKKLMAIIIDRIKNEQQVRETQVKPAPPAPAPDTDSTFTDKRDGKVYRIVKIGGQTWFAENLNYAAEGSKCYGNKPENCARFGRLYNLETALTACPAGTHLATEEDWTELINYAGGDEKATTKLRSSRGWRGFKNSAGTDEYGFSALPGGQGDSDGYFNNAGHVGRWWIFTRHGAFGGVVIRDVEYEDFFFGADETGLFSVRCVQDKREEKGAMPIIKSKKSNKSKNKNQKNKSKDNKKGTPPLRGEP